MVGLTTFSSCVAPVSNLLSALPVALLTGNCPMQHNDFVRLHLQWSNTARLSPHQTQSKIVLAASDFKADLMRDSNPAVSKSSLACDSLSAAAEVN